MFIIVVLALCLGAIPMLYKAQDRGLVGSVMAHWLVAGLCVVMGVMLTATVYTSGIHQEFQINSTSYQAFARPYHDPTGMPVQWVSKLGIHYNSDPRKELWMKCARLAILGLGLCLIAGRWQEAKNSKAGSSQGGTP